MKFSIKPTLLFFCLLTFNSIYAQTTISGTISDKDTEEPLPYVGIQIEGTTIGTSTDLDGNFSIETRQEPPITLRIEYAGYQAQSIDISEVDKPLKIQLEAGVNLDEVLVTQPGKPVKISESITSTTTISAKEIELTTVFNPISLLENTEGVTIEKQGGNRTNITMRGGSDLFSTSTYILMDYRSLIGVGLNTFEANTTALNTLDIERVEAIKGPASALWGAGVTSGVVHFVTKNPFKYPGTSVEMVGGNLNTYKLSVRHAAHTKDYKLGYKINTNFTRNGEWELDPEDETDAATMTNFKEYIIDPIDGDTVRFTGGKLVDEGKAFGANATLIYKPLEDLTLTTIAGFTYFDGLFWNQQGEGYQQATDYFAQMNARYGNEKTGNLFVQFYWNGNFSPKEREKKGFLYRSGQVSIVDRQQYELQLQYSYNIKPIRTDFTIGGDYRGAKFDTETRTFGRNENDDDFDLYGGYIQTKSELIEDKFNLILAARYDAFSAIDETAFSPRVGLVYNHNDVFTTRASYNRAYAPTSNLNLNIDFQLAQPGGAPFDLWLFGNKVPQTFENPSTTWFIPGIPETPGVGMDIGISYPFITSVLADLIAGGDPNVAGLAPLLPILQDPATMGAIASTQIFTQGVPLDLNGNPMNIEGVSQSTLREDNTLELGFSGVIKKKFSFTADFYQVRQKNFTGLRQISPLLFLPTMGADLNTNIVPILTQIYTQYGVDYPEQTAIATGQAYQGIADGVTTSPLGTVETDQMPEDGLPHVAYGYRNFGKLTYYGMDLSAKYLLPKNISVFANYSWVNKNSFRGADLGEAEESNNRYDLNFAKNKLRAGAQYQPQKGIIGGLGFSYNGEFESTLGFYVGTVKARALLDANVGYVFKNGIYLNLAVDNLTHNKYRTFPGLPEIGTRILATIRYTFLPK